MADKTKIEWTDASWNPIRGCSRVSEGCRNCYAEHVAARFSGAGQPYQGLAQIKNIQRPDGSTKTTEYHWTGEVRLIEERLQDPLRWKRPRMIFVNSMSDLFHERVEDEWIDKIRAVMALSPVHVFQILTKRPERMLAYLGHHHAPLKNVWLGVSVEDQQTANERIPLLLQTPAAVRWVSYEPALGPVDFTAHSIPAMWSGKLHWIVAGGESGKAARPANPDWFRSARDQCQAAGVAFFFKQWGEWMPTPREESEYGASRPGMSKVGKKSAGRLLDDREWNQYPCM